MIDEENDNIKLDAHKTKTGVHLPSQGDAESKAGPLHNNNEKANETGNEGSGTINVMNNHYVNSYAANTAHEKSHSKTNDTALTFDDKADCTATAAAYKGKDTADGDEDAGENPTDTMMTDHEDNKTIPNHKDENSSEMKDIEEVKYSFSHDHTYARQTTDHIESHFEFNSPENFADILNNGFNQMLNVDAPVPCPHFSFHKFTPQGSPTANFNRYFVSNANFLHAQ